jgi:hypothetical protein
VCNNGSISACMRRTQVTGSGMVHEIPQDLENGLLHAPHRIHSGVVPHFQIHPHVDDLHKGKITPDTKAADIPGPLVTQTSRTRPFHMSAVLPSSNPFLLRVRRWQRGCYVSPELLHQLPPWGDILIPQKGVIPCCKFRITRPVVVHKLCALHNMHFT